MTCDTCRFWVRLKPGGFVGHCRRYPPWVECDDKSSWPVTSRGDWCGEHQPRDDASPPTAGEAE